MQILLQNYCLHFAWLELITSFWSTPTGQAVAVQKEDRDIRGKKWGPDFRRVSHRQERPTQGGYKIDVNLKA